MKKLLKKLKAMAEEEGLRFVHGRGCRKMLLQKDIENPDSAMEKLKG